MGKKENEAQPKKKGIFSLIKESMTKTSSGCGPGCGCTPSEPTKKKRKEDTGEKSDKNDS